MTPIVHTRGARRGGGTRKSGPLFELLAELDQRTTPKEPVEPAVWVALLAAPLVSEAAGTAPGGRPRRGRPRSLAAAPPAPAAAGRVRWGLRCQRLRVARLTVRGSGAGLACLGFRG
jgi:hypothetical protein